MMKRRNTTRRALSNAERQRRYRIRKKIEAKFLSHGAGREQKDAVLELLESLPRVVARQDGPYTLQDRARDFIAVFNGTSAPDQGRRVLSQIHQICDPHPDRKNADKAGTLAFNEGMRRVMAEIMFCFVVKEPLIIERSDPRVE